MRKFASVTLFAALLFAACGTAASKEDPKNNPEIKAAPPGGHWKGSFSNGMKGAKISFDVAGNEVKNLIFHGYWRCDGKLELTTIGPEKSYAIKGKSVDGTLKEQGFYFALQGTFTGKKAAGTLRFAFASGDCDTYKLNWTAEKE